MKAWNPILINTERQQVDQKIEEIASVLFNSTFEGVGVGLYSGKTGVAQFLLLYSKLTGNQRYATKAAQLLEEVLETQNKNMGNGQYSLCNGLAGITWALDNLARIKLLDQESSLISEDIEHYLFNTMISNTRSGNYDFLHGSLGVALFFLDTVDKGNRKNYVHEFIEEISLKRTDFNEGELAWISVLDYEKGTLGYNLGLAHGLPSMIAFLSKAYVRGINTEKCSFLLQGALKYLMSKQLDISVHGSYFPSWIREGEDVSSSRLAWCYGDLGIANSLWIAAQALKDDSLEQFSLQILKHTVGRVNPSQSRVVDAGICHGSSGIAHLYNRMYQRTGHDIFRYSASNWFQLTLNLACHKDGLAGYKVKHLNEMLLCENLLEGIAGIGLTFISAISEIEPKWDECLLIS